LELSKAFNYEVQFVDNKCDWSAAKNWAEWWMRSNHFQWLCYTKIIPPEVWDKYPSTKNAGIQNVSKSNPSHLKWS